MKLGWLGFFFYFLPKPPYMNIHRTQISQVIIFPYNFQKTFTTVYLAGMAGKKLKQIKLLCRQVDVLSHQW